MSMLILGAKGQLGTALQAKYPNALGADLDQLDVADQASIDLFDWSNIEVVINAAAYTDVDGAETIEGRMMAWRTNAQGPANLVRAALHRNLTVVHISTDHVFDGTRPEHTETEPFSPLSAYGSSKAAGDVVVGLLPKHYLIRTSWVIGQGKNFVRTMLEVGRQGVNPTVVGDQFGRPTFTSELVRAIDHLLTAQAQFGTYNVSNSGQPVSWANLTRKIYELAGLQAMVTDTTTAEYFRTQPAAAPRPLNSTLTLEKLRLTGFTSVDWQEDLATYIKAELRGSTS